MSKQVLEALANAMSVPPDAKRKSIKITIMDITQVAEEFRKESEYAVHKLNISTSTLKRTVETVLNRLKIIGPEEATDQDTKLVRNEVAKVGDISLKMAMYLRQAFLDAVNRLPEGTPVYVSGYYIVFASKTISNFERISRFFVEAAGLGSTESQNTAFKTLISQFFIFNDIGDENFHKSLSKILDRADNLIDKGHSALSSNIAQAIGAMIVNGVQTQQNTINLLDNSPESIELRKSVSKELGRLEIGMRNALLNKESSDARSLFNRSYNGTLEVGAVPPEDEAFIKAIIQIGFGFVRRVLSGKVKIQVGEKKLINKALIAEIARSVTVGIFPQDSRENRIVGAALEKRIGVYFKSGGFGLLLKRYLLEPTKPEFKKLGLPPFPELEGSKTFNDLHFDMLYESLEYGKPKDKNIVTPTVFSKKGGKYTPKVKIDKKPKLAPKPKKVPVPTVETARRRARGGYNLINVVNLINLKLADKIRENMGSPRLNYRTGRFASSAKVLPASMDKDGALRFPYTYMKYPYQTFEVGYAKGDAKRDPRVVISESIRELATKIVLMRMRVVRV